MVQVIHDIGLVKVKETIQFNDLVQPIPLRLEPLPAGAYPIIISGWGRWIGGPPGVNPPEVELPDKLQHFNSTSVDYQLCKEMLRGYESAFYVDQICTLNGGGIGACNADSGGPVAFQGKIVGVVSWGVDECSGKYPDVHASVSYYAEWITSKLTSE